MVRNSFDSEQELAKIVVSHLKDLRWEVYQEVVCPGGVADIVAKMGNILWVIECKKSFSMSLLGQAIERTPYFHYTSIAVPYSRRDNRKLLREFLEWKGIGCFEVYNHNYYENISTPTEPRLHRKARTKHIKLYAEQKNMVDAGSSNGGYFTPFKKTCRRVQEIVRNEPGIILKDLIDKTDHHYSTVGTAKQSIRHFIDIGVIEGIKMKKDGKYLRFYPEEDRELKDE
ncbi:MAG: hypothetical protein JW944_00685 [Deltaproteobacteria bacterium]|nr:hypothetical protein [Deltaproteobacteria bacterium]